MHFVVIDISQTQFALFKLFILYFKHCLAIHYDTMLMLPNQELSVLYGGPTLNYGVQLSLYVSYMLRVNMTGDVAHLQLSDLQGET